MTLRGYSTHGPQRVGEAVRGKEQHFTLSAWHSESKTSCKTLSALTMARSVLGEAVRGKDQCAAKISVEDLVQDTSVGSPPKSTQRGKQLWASWRDANRSSTVRLVSSAKLRADQRIQWINFLRSQLIHLSQNGSK